MGQTTPLRVLDAPLLAFLGPLHKGPQRVVDEELGDEAGAVLPLQLDRSVAIILPRLDLLLFVSRAPPSHRTALSPKSAGSGTLIAAPMMARSHGQPRP